MVQSFPIILIMSLHVDDYFRNTLCPLNSISMFYYYHWVDTDGIIRPVVSVSHWSDLLAIFIA